MKIALCGSMAFAKEMLRIKDELIQMGHSVLIPDFTNVFVGKTEQEKEMLNRTKIVKHDAIIEHYKKIKRSDAILVLNYDRKGIKHYIGGNTVMEIGFAHVLGKCIYLLYAIPEIPLYKSEIQAVGPIIISGNLQNIR